MARAKALLAVAAGKSYTQAARENGLLSGDTVANWVARFNEEGLNAVIPRHGGGRSPRYNHHDREKIRELAHSTPDPEIDGVQMWSLNSLRDGLILRGLPAPSIHTLWDILHNSGFGWLSQRSPHVKRRLIKVDKGGRQTKNLIKN